MKNQLPALFQKLNRIYFERKLKCRLVWGVARSARVKRSRRLGSYNPRTNTITLHPVLNQSSIPPYVLASVLHHEMCHAFVPSKKIRGKLYHHGVEFRKKEKDFAYYTQANQWIKKNLRKLFQPPEMKKDLKYFPSNLQLSLFH